MRHPLLLLLIIVGMLTFARAQTQINYEASDYAVPGDTQLVGIDTTTAVLIAGPDGSGQTWDFSMLAVDDSITALVSDGSGTPYANSFPDADLAFSINTLYVYQTSNADSVEDLGLGLEVPLGGTTFNRAVRFDEPFITLLFPVAESDTWSDTASFTVGAQASEVNAQLSFLYDSVRWRRTTRKAVEVDGSGTIRLPNDTIAEVLRVRALEYHRDDFEGKTNFGGNWTALNLPGVVESPTFDTTITYSYYSPGFPLPVLSFTVGLDDSVGVGGISFHHPPRKMAVGISEAQLSSIRLFPNPTADGLLTLHSQHDWSASTEVKVYNSTGQLVARHTTNAVIGRSIEIDLSNQAVGLYVVQVASNQESWQQRVVKH